MHQFIVTMKNMALYPPTSQTNRQALTLLYDWLMEFIEAYGPVVLVVTKDGLFTEAGEMVYKEKPSEQLLSFPLFRDGIQTIIFEHALTEEELRVFINIMHRFRTLTEDDHDDVVTTMWEASFAGVKYTVADEYEEVGPEFELDALVCARPPQDRPDIDAPYQAIAPTQVEGSAPVAKSIGSLFALADSLDFSFAPGGADGKVDDPHAGGKLLSDSPDAADDQEDPEDDGGFDPFQSAPDGDGDGYGEDEDGFAPFQSATNAGDLQDSAGDGAEFDDGFPGAFASRGGGAGGEAGAEGASGAAAEGASGSGGSGALGGLDFGAEPPPPEEGATPAEGGGNWAENVQNLDLTSLSMDADSFHDNTQIEATVTVPEEEKPDVDEKLLAGRAERLKYWGLSSREIKQVSSLIQWDEARGRSYSTIELMLIVLKSPIVKSAMRPSIVSFLAEEIKECCRRVFLGHVNDLLSQLQEMMVKSSRAVIAAIYEDIIRKVNTVEFLEVLCLSVETEELASANYEDLRYFLYQLPPQAVFTLGELLSQVKVLRLKKLFIEVMAYGITKSAENVGKLVPLLNEWAILELVSLIQVMRHPVPIPLIASLSRHESAAVREMAARFILDNDPENTHAIAHMIIDPDPKIRHLVTPTLTRRRDANVEGILQNYLMECRAKKNVGREVIPFYQAFGKAASYRSVNFLADLLLKKDIGSLFGGVGDYHRLGAALALLLMPETTGAMEIFRKASRSAFRSVRWACAEARKLTGEAGNGQ
jgi:hypothetical protein